MITLEYSTTSSVVTLRSPDIGDGVQQQLHTIVRRSRGGKLLAYRSTDWNKTKILSYSNIPVLTETEKDDFLDFLDDSAGQIVELTDHHGDSYDGIIVDQSIEVATNKDTCSYSLSFNFRIKDIDSCYVEAENEDLLATESDDNLVLETCGEI